jgi:site-specific recombinase XerD
MSTLKSFLSQYDSGETRRAYERDISRFMADKNAKSVHREQAIEYLNTLKDLDLGASSIRRMIASLRSYFKFLINNDVIVKNPFDGLKMPHINRKYEPGLTDEEVGRMIGVIKNNPRGKRDKAILYLMLYNGLRRSEVCGLNHGDIQDVPQGTVIEVRGKGDKVRIIPLHDECEKAIDEYTNANPEFEGPEDPVLTIRGNRITSGLVYDTVRRISKAAGLVVHPHQLRSKFVSMELESGKPITSVQYDVGHASIETTASYDRAKTRFDRSAIPTLKSIKPIYPNGEG